MKIEKFEVLQSPILTSLIYHWIREFSMEKLELQEPISQLLNALKSHFFACECFQIDGSEQLKKSHNFKQNHVCDVTTSELY